MHTQVLILVRHDRMANTLSHLNSDALLVSFICATQTESFIDIERVVVGEKMIKKIVSSLLLAFLMSSMSLTVHLLLVIYDETFFFIKSHAELLKCTSKEAN